MSRRPFEDTTTSHNQQKNIENSSVNCADLKTPPRSIITSIRRNDPYAVNVLPASEEEANELLQRQLVAAIERERAKYYYESPRNLYTMVEPPTQPNSPLCAFPSPQSLTKVYHGGRPVPALKMYPTEPVIMDVLVSGPQIVTVKFRYVERTYLAKKIESFFTTEREALSAHVIVDGDRGIDLGRVVSLRAVNHSDNETLPQDYIQRVASNEEISRFENTLADEDMKATSTVVSQCAKLGLKALTVIDASFQFDKQKLTIRYRTPERVYFVPLLKTLNAVYKCRIWMEKVEM